MIKRRMEHILRERRIVITCGTGGVGKTTLSAAIALHAALKGKRAAVITIDPAKRLATSLGITSLNSRPTDLTHPVLEVLLRLPPSQRPDPSQIGRFVALMPDTASNFRDILKDLAPSPQIVEKILANPIFQIFTKEFSGTNEYMAVDRLQAIDALREYDLIVLDTPPSRNALAFLKAPKVLAEFFDERIIRWLILPTNSLLTAGLKKAMSILERLTGAKFMTNLLDFASTLFEVRVRFVANLQKTLALLESSGVGFIMVTAPSPDTVAEVTHFIDTLKEHRFHFDGVALNRTLHHLHSAPSGANTLSEAEKLVDALKTRQYRALEAFSNNHIPICARLPELARDVHSLEDLIYVAMALDALD